MYLQAFQYTSIKKKKKTEENERGYFNSSSIRNRNHEKLKTDCMTAVKCNIIPKFAKTLFFGSCVQKLVSSAYTVHIHTLLNQFKFGSTKFGCVVYIYMWHVFPSRRLFHFIGPMNFIVALGQQIQTHISIVVLFEQQRILDKHDIPFSIVKVKKK